MTTSAPNAFRRLIFSRLTLSCITSTDRHHLTEPTTARSAPVLPDVACTILPARRCWLKAAGTLGDRFGLRADDVKHGIRSVSGSSPQRRRFLKLLDVRQALRDVVRLGDEPVSAHIER